MKSTVWCAVILDDCGNENEGREKYLVAMDALTFVAYVQAEEEAVNRTGDVSINNPDPLLDLLDGFYRDMCTSLHDDVEMVDFSLALQRLEKGEAHSDGTSYGSIGFALTPEDAIEAALVDVAWYAQMCAKLGTWEEEIA